MRARNSAGAGPWSWDSSLNTGRATPLTPVYGTPVATAYHLRYRQSGATDWQKSGALSGGRWSNIYTTSETIQSLGSGTTYEVQVRALIEDSIGAWSASATGTTQ